MSFAIRILCDGNSVEVTAGGVVVLEGFFVDSSDGCCSAIVRDLSTCQETSQQR